MSTSTRRCSLRPVTEDDVVKLRAQELMDDLLWTWRHHGIHPPPQQFRSEFWIGVVQAYIVCRRRDDTAVGVVVVYNADFANQRLYIGAYAFPAFRGTGLVPEAVASVIRTAFRNWPIQRIFIEIPEFNEGPVARVLRRHFTPEGELSKYWFHNGRWWSHRVYSIDREAVLAIAEGPLARLFMPPPLSQS